MDGLGSVPLEGGAVLDLKKEVIGRWMKGVMPLIFHEYMERASLSCSRGLAVLSADVSISSSRRFLVGGGLISLFMFGLRVARCLVCVLNTNLSVLPR